MPENLQPYEIDFCQAFQTENKAERKKALQNVTVGLVKSVSEKMKGFSRKETIQYYTAIMEKAWQQVTDADTPEVKSETYEQVMDWTMLDKEWEGRTQNTFDRQPVFLPTWWWRFDPVMGAPKPQAVVACCPSRPCPPRVGHRAGHLPCPSFPALILLRQWCRVWKTSHPMSLAT